MNYERMNSIEDFGSQLITTEDLDPLYVALAGADLERDQLRRWLFAYWCCYHAGAASWISEQTKELYWYWLGVMARNSLPSPLNGRWPRGHERRHFRGQRAVDAVEYFAEKWTTVEGLVAWLEASGPKFQSLRERVLTLPMFGPWIAFKVGDMFERVVHLPLSFADSDVLMFEQPYKSALEVYRQRTSVEETQFISEDRAVIQAVSYLTAHFSQFYTAPPKHDRNINIQEVETILCKWKSHLKGSYPPGLDTRELAHGLTDWGATANRLLQNVPKHAAA